jgi:hypothetical protein
VDEPTIHDRLEFLLAAAVWQDSLLQGYRSISITSQSVLLAVGAVLLGASLNTDDAVSVGLLGAQLVTVAGVALYALRTMTNVIRARGEDVNWWHRRIIDLEGAFPIEESPFTQFKIHQQQHRRVLPMQHRGRPSSQDLIGSGMGHTRIAVDKYLVWALKTAWVALVAIEIIQFFRVAR